MAAETGTALDSLSLLREIAAEPHRHGFFHALRCIECAYPDSPRIGASKRLKEDSIRFGQTPSLAFAPSSLLALELPDGDRPARLIEYFFGLFGANGPLPHYLTEYARDRQRNAGDATLVRFLDTFHHRLISLFYRAWADAQPTVNLDRPDSDAFGRRVGALCGLGMKSLRDRDRVPDFAKLAHVGLLARQVRNADGLAWLLGDYFRVPVAVSQFQPHWMALPREAQTRLGRGETNAQLGLTAIAGLRVWDCQSRFRIVLGPLSLGEYERFLPGRASLCSLADWVKNYVGFEFSWELQLVLRKEQVPRSWLGNSTHLGWTSWLGVRSGREDAADLVLQGDEIA